MRGVDRIIYTIQGSVPQMLAAVDALPADEKEALLQEFAKRPDIRFSDDQLVTLSLYQNPIPH